MVQETLDLIQPVTEPNDCGKFLYVVEVSQSLIDPEVMVNVVEDLASVDDVSVVDLLTLLESLDLATQ